ncbi:MAG: UDP-N-acetylglucosamine 2-epimerase (non-hydrolyzing) [Bacteroidota bacterium]|nr:UDP-N-acetylglucosamine 2-epimerase (non-hydrolyzing) [Bacteroidota bacterium]MDP4250563.1 UDP-N-acetylglucosamine 2-epimerase (non-hydrolyzing) [Bacteroidota bacterium]
MKIMHIVGNRPQFIKLALLHKELSLRDAPGIVLHTGQHFDENMSDIFFSQLRIPSPKHFLSINRMSHNVMIGNMLIQIDQILGKEKPALVIVYGDTNSTLAGALATCKRNIALAHVEAGIRTGNALMPEESNRYLTDRMANYNFCCTYQGVKNLEQEGFGPNGNGPRIYNTGDLMLDATLSFAKMASERPAILKGTGLPGNFVLASIHREENRENPDYLRNIILALNSIHVETPVLMPVHPKTKDLLRKYAIETSFTVLEPLGYLDMLSLLQKCSSVITDSGGLSREAFFMRKPTLVIMQFPFWPELFIHGNCARSDAQTEDILRKHQGLLETNRSFDINIFGDGHAAEKISDAIVSAF